MTNNGEIPVGDEQEAGSVPISELLRDGFVQTGDREFTRFQANAAIPVGDEQLAGVSENPVRCLKCGSEDVSLLCRVVAEYRIEGNLGEEQDWLRGSEDVADDTAEPYGARCNDCEELFGVTMEGEFLVGLVPQVPEPEKAEDTCEECGDEQLAEEDATETGDPKSVPLL